MNRTTSILKSWLTRKNEKNLFFVTAQQNYLPTLRPFFLSPHKKGVTAVSALVKLSFGYPCFYDERLLRRTGCPIQWRKINMSRLTLCSCDPDLASAPRFILSVVGWLILSYRRLSGGRLNETEMELGLWFGLG
jgi:hypothetical protein